MVDGLAVMTICFNAPNNFSNNDVIITVSVNTINEEAPSSFPKSNVLSLPPSWRRSRVCAERTSKKSLCTADGNSIFIPKNRETDGVNCLPNEQWWSIHTTQTSANHSPSIRPFFPIRDALAGTTNNVFDPIRNGAEILPLAHSRMPSQTARLPDFRHHEMVFVGPDLKAPVEPWLHPSFRIMLSNCDGVFRKPTVDYAGVDSRKTKNMVLITCWNISQTDFTSSGWRLMRNRSWLMIADWWLLVVPWIHHPFSFRSRRLENPLAREIIVRQYAS